MPAPQESETLNPVPQRRPVREVTFRQRLWLTTEQERHLRTVWRVVQDLDRIVTLFHRHHSVGQPVPLDAVAAAVLDGADALPALPLLDTPAHDPMIPVRPFVEGIRALCRSRGWDRLAPLQTFEGIVRERCRWYGKWRWSGATLRYTPDCNALSDRLDLWVGTTMQFLDPVTLRLPFFGDHPDVLLDAVRLPPRFQAAFDFEGRRQVFGLVRALTGAQKAAQEGWEWGPSRVAELTTRFPNLRADPNLPEPVREDGQPRLLHSARILQVDGVDGNLHHVIEWRFDVRGCTFTPWVFDDVLGVDVGERYLFTAVSGQGQQMVRSAVHRVPPLPRLASDTGELDRWEAVHGTPLTPVLTGQQEALRREAIWRHRTYLQLQPQFAELLNSCLLHRQVGLEALNLANMRKKNWSFPAFMDRSGLGDVLGWIGTLAPLHGVTVHQVDARRSSKTCSRCGAANSRPGDDKIFRCRQCGLSEKSDLNAARVIRQRALAAVGETADAESTA